MDTGETVAHQQRDEAPLLAKSHLQILNKDCGDWPWPCCVWAVRTLRKSRAANKPFCSFTVTVRDSVIPLGSYLVGCDNFAGLGEASLGLCDVRDLQEGLWLVTVLPELCPAENEVMQRGGMCGFGHALFSDSAPLCASMGSCSLGEQPGLQRGGSRGPHGAEGGSGVCFQGGGAQDHARLCGTCTSLGWMRLPKHWRLVKQERVVLSTCAVLPGQRTRFPSHPQSHGQSVAVMYEG